MSYLNQQREEGKGGEKDEGMGIEKRGRNGQRERRRKGDREKEEGRGIYMQREKERVKRERGRNGWVGSENGYMWFQLSMFLMLSLHSLLILGVVNLGKQ